MLQKVESKPLVTVIVPAYNEGKHIEECLESIKNQTYSNIELIVVDDESKDDTAKIAKKYGDMFLSQKHQGPGVARNKAAKIAKGEILVFIDADMYLDKDYIRNIIRPIIGGKVKATFTKEEYLANSENVWVKCYIYDNKLSGNKKNLESNSQYNYFRAISKKNFQEFGGYDSKLGYNDDELINNREIKSELALGAISFHYNPDNLLDIFFSSRWIGRSPKFKRSVKNLMRYSIINSMKLSIGIIKQGAPKRFIFYKLFFDFGIFIGILFNNQSSNFSK